MKKVIIFLLVSAMTLSPQIVLAAWWNPFSWKFFRKDNKTRILEERLVELEKKLKEKDVSEQTLDTSTTSATTTKVFEKLPVKLEGGISVTPSNPVIVPKAITLEVIDYELVYKELINNYRAFQRSVRDDSVGFKSVRLKSNANKDRSDYVERFLIDLDYLVRGLDNLSTQPPKTSEMLEPLQSKLAQLKTSYNNSISNYSDLHDEELDSEARNQVVDYMRTNKYSLHIPSYHVTAANLFDLYDRVFNTKYAAPFRMTKTQVETVEFVNVFLVDLGEPLEVEVDE